VSPHSFSEIDGDLCPGSSTGIYKWRVDDGMTGLWYVKSEESCPLVGWQMGNLMALSGIN
jgi:hypothetical protein